MTARLWLRVVIVFGSYLLLSTVVFALLSTFSSPSTLPKAVGLIVINGTVFVVPFVGYYFVLRRADAVQLPNGNLRYGMLWGLCIALTVVSCLGLMFWFFLLHFGRGAFT